MVSPSPLVQAASLYLPAEWRLALARGVCLSDRTNGAALFADLSGFTPVTKALALTYGPRRGIEFLSLYRNRVYDALIAAVDRYGGSVISLQPGHLPSRSPPPVDRRGGLSSATLTFSFTRSSEVKRSSAWPRPSVWRHAEILFWTPLP